MGLVFGFHFFICSVRFCRWKGMWIVGCRTRECRGNRKVRQNGME